MSKNNPIPAGYTAVTPYLLVEGAAEFLGFLSAAFNAEERLRVPMPEGGIGHAEVEIGGAVLMVADAFPPDFPATSSLLHFYVEDVDRIHAQAVEAGATSLAAPSDEEYGDRMARVLDPCGNQWIIATAGGEQGP